MALHSALFSQTVTLSQHLLALHQTVFVGEWYGCPSTQGRHAQANFEELSSTLRRARWSAPIMQPVRGSSTATCTDA
ncbi:hypothetical protein BU26DRAFT_514378 [Trematosphaeria pertusa]|uniref:Uncharacterized protein n=1 Tax=Trematosphaeria pertusa TaxID=390896 RepID=A0A6A6IZ75_9PLEO|nr:uncharacterized protein BU26DRAFT_514378 [Trematosphaeria pertusa]KAF2254473.1 hypothetical protein BU26DRAFT_514378 [Trematosphaeria pertusa]